MQKINQVFNDTYFGTRILANATKLRDTLEKNKDIEIQNASTETEKEEIENTYKRKLQAIYRIRNNAYSYLLTNKFQCTYEINKEDNSKIFYMNIEGIIYDCKESAVKNILGKEYETIVQYCLPQEEYTQIIEEESIKEEATIVTKPAQKNKKDKTSISNDIADQLLDVLESDIEIFGDDNLLDIKKDLNKNKIDIIPIKEESSDNNIQKNNVDEITNDLNIASKISRCPRCFAPLNENQDTCDFCGYEITVKKTLTREELANKDVEDEFSEEDIDKMFEELEQRLNETNNNTNVTIKTITPKLEVETTIDPEDLETVRLYNPEKSEPMKKRSEMIMDIYTLKLKDPKQQNDDGTQIKEEHRRKRKSEYEAELNSPHEEIVEDEIIREVKIFVYPLSVPESGSELSSEILVFITQDGNCGSFCSGLTGINSVKVNTNIHNFIVRGQWDNGNFITKVIGNGKTLIDSCEIERVKEEIRPDDIVSAKLGHPITFLSVEYVDGTETVKIHAVPISDENEEDGYAKTLYLMENVNLKERKLFITKASNYITFEFEEEIYKATAKWKDDTFKMKVANY